MYDDPIVAEIRRLRDDYARQFDYDLDRICRDLKERQSRSKRKLVRMPANRTAESVVDRAENAG